MEIEAGARPIDVANKHNIHISSDYLQTNEQIYWIMTSPIASAPKARQSHPPASNLYVNFIDNHAGQSCWEQLTISTHRREICDITQLALRRKKHHFDATSCLILLLKSNWGFMNFLFKRFIEPTNVKINHSNNYNSDSGSLAECP